MFGHINIFYIHRKYKRDDHGNLSVELGEITGMSGRCSASDMSVRPPVSG